MLLLFFLMTQNRVKLSQNDSRMNECSVMSSIYDAKTCRNILIHFQKHHRTKLKWYFRPDWLIRVESQALKCAKKHSDDKNYIFARYCYYIIKHGLMYVTELPLPLSIYLYAGRSVYYPHIVAAAGTFSREQKSCCKKIMTDIDLYFDSNIFSCDFCFSCVSIVNIRVILLILHLWCCGFLFLFFFY